MINDALLIKIARKINDSWQRKDYEEILIESGLYSLSTIKDNEEYLKLSKYNLILNTLRSDADELLIKINLRRRFPDDLLNELADAGIRLKGVKTTSTPERTTIEENISSVQGNKDANEVPQVSPIAQEEHVRHEPPPNIMIVENVVNSQIHQGPSSTLQTTETTREPKVDTRKKIKDWAIIIGPIVILLAAIIGVWGNKIQVEIPISATKTAESLATSRAKVVIHPSLTPSFTSSFTSSITPVFSPTSERYFFDDFSSKSKYPWILPNSPGGASVKAGIEQGVLKITVNCPKTNPDYYCTPYIRIPNVNKNNFNISFDVLYEQLTTGASSDIGVIFRFDSLNGNYYSAQYIFGGQCSLSEYYAGDTIGISTENIGPDYYPVLNTLYQYGLIANKDGFTMSVDGKVVISEINGDINAVGPIDLYFYVSRGSTTTINLDNLLITAP